MSSIRQVFRSQRSAETEQRVRMLIPVAGNDGDQRLLQYVSKIAQRKNSEITLIYVVEVDQELPLDAELPLEVTHGEQVLENAREALRSVIDNKSSAVSTDMLQARLAGPAIVDEAVQDESDVIILGAHVTKRHGKRTIGDTVDYVLKNAPCEVIVLRNPMPKSLMQELEMDLE